MERTSVPSSQTKAVDVSSTNPSPQAGTNAPAYTSVTRSEGGGTPPPPGTPTPTAPPPEAKMGWIEKAYSAAGDWIYNKMGGEEARAEASRGMTPTEIAYYKAQGERIAKGTPEQRAAAQKTLRAERDTALGIAAKPEEKVQAAKSAIETSRTVLQTPASFVGAGAAINLVGDAALAGLAQQVGDKQMRNDALLGAAFSAIPGGGAYKAAGKGLANVGKAAVRIAGREGAETVAKETGEALIKAGAKEGAETAAKSATSKVAKEVDRGPFLDDYLKQLEAKTAAQAEKNAQAKAAAELAAKTRPAAGTQAVARGIETAAKVGYLAAPLAAAGVQSGLIPTQTNVSNVPQPQRQPPTQPSTQPQPQQAQKPSPQQSIRSSTEGQTPAPGMRPQLSRQSSVGGSRDAGSAISSASDTLQRRAVSFLKQGYEPMNNRKKFIEEQVRMILSEKIRRERSYGDEEPTEQPRRGRKMPESGEERETRERGEDRRPTERVAQ